MILYTRHAYPATPESVSSAMAILLHAYCSPLFCSRELESPLRSGSHDGHRGQKFKPGGQTPLMLEETFHLIVAYVYSDVLVVQINILSKGVDRR